MHRTSPSRTSRRAPVTESLLLANLADVPDGTFRGEGELKAHIRARRAFFPVLPAGRHDVAAVRPGGALQRVETEAHRGAAGEPSAEHQEHPGRAGVTRGDLEHGGCQVSLYAGGGRGLEG